MLLKSRLSGAKIALPEFQDGDKTAWRFRARTKFFSRFIEVYNLHVSFLTFTLSTENILADMKIFYRVIHDMCDVVRRSGHKIFYLSVVEIQVRRYYKTGKLVPHLHIAVATDAVGLFPHAGKSGATGRIKKVRDGKVITFDWLYKNAKQKLGIYFCCDAWSNNLYNYLGKYLAKPALLDEFKKQYGKRLSVFSSSHLPIDFRMDTAQHMDYWRLIESHPEAKDLYWRREGSRIVGRGKLVDERYYEDGRTFVKISYPKILTISSEWIVDQGGDLPPLEGDS